MAPAASDAFALDLASLRAQADRAVLLFDFDGTLSPMVDDPASAAPVAGAADLLDRLAQSYRCVAVLSGRPVAFLANHLPPSVELSGLYGLETRRDGVVVDHPDAARWRPVVHQAVADASHATGPGTTLHGVLVEPKGLSLTLHTRTRPDLAVGAAALAESLGAATGLEVRPAKMSVELHPPIHADKGSAVRELAAGASAALFVGDDVGDLPAFDALAALGHAGTLDPALAVVVDGPELPAEVRARAQALVAGPIGVVALLESLLI